MWSCLFADVEIKCEGLTHLTSVILNRLISLLRRNVSEGICGHRTMECVEMPEEIDFTKLTVVEIKEELRKRGLKAGQGCFCNCRSPGEVERKSDQIHTKEEAWCRQPSLISYLAVHVQEQNLHSW